MIKRSFELCTVTLLFGFNTLSAQRNPPEPGTNKFSRNSVYVELLGTGSKNFVFFALILFFGACTNSEPDVFKTKSGMYGSLEGEFIANLPNKPIVLTQKNSLGDIEYTGVNFISSVGMDYDYHVSYIDYPQLVWEGWELEDLFDQSAKVALKRSDIFDRLEKEPLADDGYERQVDYMFRSSKRGVTSFMKIRMMKLDKRVYTLTFIGLRNIPETEKIEAFFDSFKIYKPVKSHTQD